MSCIHIYFIFFGNRKGWKKRELGIYIYLHILYPMQPREHTTHSHTREKVCLLGSRGMGMGLVCPFFLTLYEIIIILWFLGLSFELWDFYN